MRHRFGPTVEFEARVAGGVVDGFEQPESFADPVAVPGCAVAPGAVTFAEMSGMAQDRVNPDRVQCTVYAPLGTEAHNGDRATVPGYGVLEVLDVAVWERNPFTGRTGGMVILCGRFDG